MQVGSHHSPYWEPTASAAHGNGAGSVPGLKFGHSGTVSGPQADAVLSPSQVSPSPRLRIRTPRRHAASSYQGAGALGPGVNLRLRFGSPGSNDTMTRKQASDETAVSTMTVNVPVNVAGSEAAARRPGGGYGAAALRQALSAPGPAPGPGTYAGAKRDVGGGAMRMDGFQVGSGGPGGGAGRPIGDSHSGQAAARVPGAVSAGRRVLFADTEGHVPELRGTGAAAAGPSNADERVSEIRRIIAGGLR
jgi:hypothetical protein